MRGKVFKFLFVFYFILFNGHLFAQGLLDSISYSQYEPYNNLCPVIDGEKCITGCVASALGQIARYYAYPAKGNGHIKYQSNTAGINLELTLGGPYNWNLIKKTYKNGPYSEESRDAVAALLRDIGYAVKTDYGVIESGASGVNGAKAMIENFGYGRSLVYLERKYYTALEWETIIKKEIDLGRPVYYEAVGEKGAHSFIIDGYKEVKASSDLNKKHSLLFHINWGWEGDLDGYFYLDNPDGFTENQAMLIGLCPKKEDDKKEYVLYRLSDWQYEQGTYSIAQTWELAISMLNQSLFDFEGMIGLGLFKGDKLMEVLGETNVSLRSFSWEEGRKINIDIPDSIENGIYRCEWVYKSNSDNVYKEMCAEIKKGYGSILLNKGENEYSLTDGIIQELSLKIKTSGASPLGAVLSLWDGENVYNGIADENGLCVLDSVKIGLYKLCINLEYHPSYVKDLYVYQNSIETEVIYENVQTPILISSDTIAYSAVLKWVQPKAEEDKSWFDDIESYPDFSIDSIGKWKLSFGFIRSFLLGTSTFPNKDKAISFIVFNPGATTPAVDNYQSVYSKQKAIAAFARIDGRPCSDTLRRKIEKGGGVFSFWIRGTGMMNIPESCTVLCSINKDSVYTLENMNNSVPFDWTFFEYVLPQEAREIMFIYNSADGQSIWIDDVGYKMKIDTTVIANNPIGFAVYLNDSLKERVSALDTMYLFKNLNSGYNVLGVQALFAGGVSQIVSDTVFISETNILPDTLSDEKIWTMVSNISVLNIYPNPCIDGDFSIDIPYDGILRVYCSAGLCCFEKEIKSGKSQKIYVDKLGSGISVVELKTKQGIYRAKLLKP